MVSDVNLHPYTAGSIGNNMAVGLSSTGSDWPRRCMTECAWRAGVQYNEAVCMTHDCYLYTKVLWLILVDQSEPVLVH